MFFFYSAALIMHADNDFIFPSLTFSFHIIDDFTEKEHTSCNPYDL